MRCHKFLYILLTALPLGCYVDNSEPPAAKTVDGFRPVYGTQEQTEIKFASARVVQQPGKIYVYDKYLLVNELKEGIHVFDNSDPAHPQALGFIHMPGNTDMAIRNDVLYADHMGNLVALTAQDFATLQEKARLPLRNWSLGVPPPANTYFECVDPAKGIVLSWKPTSLTNPKCYAVR